MSKDTIPQRLFYPRAEALQLLGGISRPTLDEFVRRGKLTAVRLTGRDKGSVYYAHAEVMALADELLEAAKAKSKPRKPINRIRLAS